MRAAGHPAEKVISAVPPAGTAASFAPRSGAGPPLTTRGRTRTRDGLGAALPSVTSTRSVRCRTEVLTNTSSTHTSGRASTDTPCQIPTSEVWEPTGATMPSST